MIYNLLDGQASKLLKGIEQRILSPDRSNLNERYIDQTYRVGLQAR